MKVEQNPYQDLVEWDISSITPGMYFIKLQIGEKQYIKKLLKQ